MKRVLSPKNYVLEARKNPAKVAAIDINREFSFGRRAKSFLMAKNTGMRYGVTLVNRTEEPMQVLLAGVLIDALGLGKGASVGLASVISGVSEYNVLGSKVAGASAGDPALFESVPKSSEYPENLFIMNTALSPIQLTALKMKSTTLNGVQESTNFDGQLTAFHKTAFGEDVKREEILFENFQNPEHFKEGIVRIDLIKEQKNIIFGNESVVFITLAPETRLSLDMEFGAQTSLEQRLYRAVNRSFENLADWYAQFKK